MGNKYLLGKKHSEETRKKMSLAQLGKKKSPEHAKNIGLAKIGVPLLKIAGKNHYRWIENRLLLKDDYKDRGGQLHRDWSRNVKTRDCWKCKIGDDNCSGKIEAHHILSWKDYPELRYDINNGITLCKFHHPRKKDDEKRLSPFFKQLINTKSY